MAPPWLRNREPAFWPKRPAPRKAHRRLARRGERSWKEALLRSPAARSLALSKRRTTPAAAPNPAPTPRPGELAVAAAFGLLAALVRTLLVVAGDDRAFPYTVFYEGDSEVYFRMARALLEGTLYDRGVPFHPPGFAFLLAGLHTLAGAAEAGARVPHLAVKVALGALVGGGTVAATWLVAARFFGRSVAAVAALLVTFHFGLQVLAIAPVADATFSLLLLAALARLARLEGEARAPRPRDAIVLGALLGALVLTRAEGMLPAAILLAWGAVSAILRSRRAGGGVLPALRPWIVATAIACAVVAPWTVRNAIRLGAYQAELGPALAEPLPRFVPVTMYGPLNLALANHSGADGSFSRAALASEAASGILRFENAEHLRYILHGDEIAWTWIAAHPGEFGQLVLAKWRLYFGALTLGWTQWDLPGGFSGVRRPVDIFVPDRSRNAWIVAPLVLAGAGLAFRAGGRERRFLALAGALTAASLAVVAFFFGYARLALLVLPLWLILAARPIAGLVARLPGRRADRLGAALVVLLLGAEIFGVARGHRIEASGTTLPGSTKLDRDQPIRFRPLPPR